MTNILSQASGSFLICRFCLPGTLANMHAYILTAVTIYFHLSYLSQISDIAFLLSVSLYFTGQISPVDSALVYTQ